VAVARGADAPPLFPACRRPSLQFQIVLGLIFVILKLFNVFFCLVFDFLICSVDVTKKKEKRKV
jgi:uncharacterized membrane protein